MLISFIFDGGFNYFSFQNTLKQKKKFSLKDDILITVCLQNTQTKMQIPLCFT